MNRPGCDQRGKMNEMLRAGMQARKELLGWSKHRRGPLYVPFLDCVGPWQKLTAYATKGNLPGDSRNLIRGPVHSGNRCSFLVKS